MTSYVRPGFLLTHVANPILSRLGGYPALIVRGRRSGRLLTVPMGKPFDQDGRRYLVSGRGETHWVRNLRAAGRGVFRMSGRTIAFTATEVTGADRSELVDAYRRVLGHRVDAYFAEIPDAAGHPVFRMDPIPGEPLGGR
jgi:deazaflavin-dependent oxidoreductase (nitroreductase family)